MQEILLVTSLNWASLDRSVRYDCTAVYCMVPNWRITRVMIVITRLVMSSMVGLAAWLMVEEWLLSMVLGIPMESLAACGAGSWVQAS